MQLFTFAIGLFVSGHVFASGITSGDIELAKRQAVQELLITQKIHDQEAALKSGAMALLGKVELMHRDPNCDDSHGGSSPCWDMCVKEGYGSSTCSSRCGVSTNEGAGACWKVCGGEGYGSSTCSSRCGTNTRVGRAACWDMCGKEGYGSSTCSSRCG